MKKKHFGMVLLVFSMFVASLSFETGDNSLIRNDIDPQTSSLIEIPHTITIDKNWTETVAMYDWCTGNGTEENPYIIEGISINSNFSGPCLSIIDSAEFFIIRNSSFSYGAHKRFTGRISNAGIYMEKAENGVIDNCTFFHNKFGISILEAEKLNITNCRFFGSHNITYTGWGTAVVIQEGKEILISRCYTLNYYSGFVVRDSEEVYIDLNHIENNLFGHTDDTGVYFRYVNDSAITSNDFYGCESSTQESFGLSTSNFGASPITTENCRNITIFGNEFFNGNDDVDDDNGGGDNVGDDNGDDPSDSDSDPSPLSQTVPYGNLYMLFMVVGIVALVLIKKRRVFNKNTN